MPAWDRERGGGGLPSIAAEAGQESDLRSGLPTVASQEVSLFPSRQSQIRKGGLTEPTAEALLVHVARLSGGAAALRSLPRTVLAGKGTASERIPPPQSPAVASEAGRKGGLTRAQNCASLNGPRLISLLPASTG